MRKSTLGLTILIIIAMCIIYVYKSNSLKNKITVHLNNVAKGKKEDLSFNQFTGFDSTLILRSYTNISKLKNELGVDITEIEKTGIDVRDDINLIVLLKDRKSIVEVVPIPVGTYRVLVDTPKIFPKSYTYKLVEGNGGYLGTTFIKEK